MQLDPKYTHKLTVYSNKLKFFQLYELSIGTSYQKFCEELKTDEWDKEPRKLEIHTNFLGVDEILEVQVLPIN